MPLPRPGVVHPPEWDGDLYALRDADRAARAAHEGAAVSDHLMTAALTFLVGLVMAAAVIGATIVIARWGIW